jgi:hypothetical protein
VKSLLTDDFIQASRKLPPAVQEQARKNYRLWRINPAHSSLHFKRVHSHEPLYSVRVGLGWRALGLLEEGTIT